MADGFSAGDFLVFQLESGYGLVRLLRVDGSGPDRLWHLLVYEALFPDVESAELALTQSVSLAAQIPHVVLTDRAFERTPAARLGNQSLTAEELVPLQAWENDSNRRIFDRSLLQLLGMR